MARRWRVPRLRSVSLTARFDEEFIRSSTRRFVQWFVLAAGVGALTGLVVVAFQSLVLDAMWGRLADQTRWWAAFLPAAGLVAAWAIDRILRSRGAETSEAYVRAFHDHRARLRVRDGIAKFMAGAVTIGSGGSLGLEGPSVLYGATIGDAVQRRTGRWFDRDDRNVLMVAGAAAGIAAVFKAPLTGVVFAMEVPYRDDVARHVLGPALVASSTGYLFEAVLRGVHPIVPIVGGIRFTARDLALSLVLGAACGLVARLTIRLYKGAGWRLGRLGTWQRLAVAGASLVAVWFACEALFGRPLALGPGEDAIEASASGRYSGTLLLALLGLKAVAFVMTAGGGGVGGSFFPLVTMGAALGGAVEIVAASHSGTLLPMVGMASLLGAAYHTPLAGVSFVAEATGRAGFLVPAFVATAAAFATVGPRSISGWQRFRGPGPVERMLDVPVTSVLAARSVSVDVHDSLDRFVTSYGLVHRHRTYPVVDEGGTYLGCVLLDAAVDTPRDLWDRTTVGDILDPAHPTGRSDWSLRQALDRMSEAGVDRLPILDDEGHLVGAIATSEVFRLSEILARLRSES